MDHDRKAATSSGDVGLLPERIHLLDRPAGIYEDVIFPRVLTRSIFRWQDDRAEWEIRFPLNRYAYAGFRRPRILDLSERIDDGALRFSLTPAAMADRLSLALLSEPDEEGRQWMTEEPLAGHIRQTWGKRAVIEVPLSAFSRAAHMSPSGTKGLKGAMPWDQVREVRLILHEPIREYTPIGIRHLVLSIP